MSLYIVIPAYNEEQNIRRCVDDWYPIAEAHNPDGNSRLVIVNDGSRDTTPEKLQELAAKRPLLVPLTKENGGHGSAVLFGYRYAVERGADWIFQTDSDGQTNPAEFETFWKKRNEYDAILGNRTVRGDGKDRKLVQRVVCLLLRVVFGVKVPDANAPFRLMKRELVDRYIRKLPHDYHLPNIMLTAYFAYFREKVLFLPVTFRPREAGKNTITPKKILRIGRQAVGEFLQLRREIGD